MSPPLIETHGLTKRYRSFTAVDALDLRLEEGEVFGFLGPNGSGKTTTILMMLGLTEPSAGQARVCGFDPTHEPLQVKRLVGYLPENLGFYNDLTGRENMLYTASLNRISRPEANRRTQELLETVQLAAAANQPVGQYSRGMRQRLGLADVLLKEPRLVILDDPTLGLDPAGIQWLLGLIEEMSAQRHITIFLSSHQLHEVQRVCHRVGVMSHGKMVTQGTLPELIAQGTNDGFQVDMEVRKATKAMVKALEALPQVREARVSGNRISLECAADIRGQVAQTVVAQKGELLEIGSHSRTLEEIYLRYFQEA